MKEAGYLLERKNKRFFQSLFELFQLIQLRLYVTIYIHPIATYPSDECATGSRYEGACFLKAEEFAREQI